MFRAVFRAPTNTVSGVTTREARTAHGCRLIVHTPAEVTKLRGVFVWCFGGGYILGSAQRENDVASAMTRDHAIAVVVPDYRLAPEHPFPAAHDDAFGSLEWAIEHAPELGAPQGALVIGGESANGGLAAGVAQWAFDEGIDVLLQVLVHPMLDDRTVPCDRRRAPVPRCCNRSRSALVVAEV